MYANLRLILFHPMETFWGSLNPLALGGQYDRSFSNPHYLLIFFYSCLISFVSDMQIVSINIKWLMLSLTSEYWNLSPRTNAGIGSNLRSNKSHIVYVFKMNQRNKKPVVFHCVDLACTDRRWRLDFTLPSSIICFIWHMFFLFDSFLYWI